MRTFVLSLGKHTQSLCTIFEAICGLLAAVCASVGRYGSVNGPSISGECKKMAHGAIDISGFSVLLIFVQRRLCHPTNRMGQ